MITIKKLDTNKNEKIAKEIQETTHGNVYDGHWWVAYKNKKWVGYAWLKFIEKDMVYMGPTPTFVKPEVRGQGLQIRLMIVREKFARKHGKRQLFARVNYDNPWSANNCIKRGFRLAKQPIVGKMDENDVMSPDGVTMIYLTHPELYFVKDL